MGSKLFHLLFKWGIILGWNNPLIQTKIYHHFLHGTFQYIHRYKLGVMGPKIGGYFLPSFNHFTPPKFNMEPEKWWFLIGSSSSRGSIFRFHVSFPGCNPNTLWHSKYHLSFRVWSVKANLLQVWVKKPWQFATATYLATGKTGCKPEAVNDMNRENSALRKILSGILRYNGLS